MPVWGDGFADDGWLDLCAVDRWDVVSPDEYVRLFPRLAVGGRAVAKPVRHHLDGSLAARRWRLRHVHKAAVPLADDDPLGRDYHDAMFAGASSIVGRFCGLGTGALPDAAEDQAAVDLLDQVVRGLRENRLPPRDAQTTAAFAFFSGVHPAYVWDGGTPPDLRDAAAGWLGVLRRGRSAFMPMEVAEYLADVIAPCARDGWVVRDAQIGMLIGTPFAAARLGLASRKRCRGETTIIRPARRWWTASRTPCATSSFWPTLRPERRKAGQAPSKPRIDQSLLLD